jgi:uncharacterized membrane protein YgcG
MLAQSLFEEAVPTPAFDEVVRELDALIDDGSAAELETSLEDLFLARYGLDEAA